MLDYILVFAAGAVCCYGAVHAFEEGEATDQIDEFLDDEIQAVKDRYAATPVDDEERLAYELLILQRDGTEEIMRDAVQVDGVGPETALSIAKHYDGDYHRYRAADEAELTAVNNVGPNRATDLANN